MTAMSMNGSCSSKSISVSALLLLASQHPRTTEAKPPTRVGLFKGRGWGDAVCEDGAQALRRGKEVWERSMEKQGG
jgi:hypothetical protein